MQKGKGQEKSSESKELKGTMIDAEQYSVHREEANLQICLNHSHKKPPHWQRLCCK